MANIKKRLAANVAGNFYVDATCINRDTCRQLARSEAHLIDSIAKLLTAPFQWVLAGHGDRVCLPESEMQAQVRALLERRGATVMPGLQA
jgi:hypothetical protein